MLHDNLVSYLALAVRNKNSPFLFVGFVELLLEEHASLVVLWISALADLLFVVQDVQEMASDC